MARKRLQALDPASNRYQWSAPEASNSAVAAGEVHLAGLRAAAASSCMNCWSVWTVTFRRMRRRLHQRRPAVKLRQGAPSRRDIVALVDAWFFSMTVVTSAL